jgi:hypothetical protein
MQDQPGRLGKWAKHEEIGRKRKSPFHCFMLSIHTKAVRPWWQWCWQVCSTSEQGLWRSCMHWQRTVYEIMTFVLDIWVWVEELVWDRMGTDLWTILSVCDCPRPFRIFNKLHNGFYSTHLDHLLYSCHIITDGYSSKGYNTNIHVVDSFVTNITISSSNDRTRYSTVAC